MVDKLSTYLSENNEALSISIEYHLNSYSSHYLFEIKLMEKDISVDYIFIHGSGHQTMETKVFL